MIDARLIDCGSQEQVEENFDRVLALVDTAAETLATLDGMVDTAAETLAILDGNILNVDLATLAFSGITLAPVFGVDTVEYAMDTAAATTDVTFSITNTTYATVVCMQGETEIHTTDTATLADGANVFTLTVAVGTKSKTYTVTITKVA